jgi:hypothetical protein
MHADIGELTWKQVKHHKVHIELLIESEVVGDDSENMMHEVTEVKETIPLHEDAIPDEVSSDVTESHDFKSSVALGARAVIII